MEELLIRLKNKDESAFEEIIEKLGRQLFLIAKARIKDDGLANDAVQETLIALYLKANQIKDASKIKSWITIVLINKCNKIMKENNLYRFSYEYNEFENYTHSGNEYENLINNIDVSNAINSLNIEERTIIIMYYSKEYTIKEISKILKIRENTVKSKLLRSKNKIKEKLRGEN